MPPPRGLKVLFSGCWGAGFLQTGRPAGAEGIILGCWEAGFLQTGRPAGAEGIILGCWGVLVFYKQVAPLGLEVLF